MWFCALISGLIQLRKRYAARVLVHVAIFLWHSPQIINRGPTARRRPEAGWEGIFLMEDGIWYCPRFLFYDIPNSHQFNFEASAAPS